MPIFGSPVTQDERYMQRCLQLARQAGGWAAPNPMVGAVLVHQDRIIGEGYHRKYGEPHAEVNCLASVKEADLQKIGNSTMYVSLEPCAHWGKTPPCADLLVKHKIPRVVIGCRDPFPEVDGKGIEKLRAAGSEVIVGVLENQCLELNRDFFHFHRQHRPRVVLKWAQTVDGKIGSGGTERLHISHPHTNRLVHQWRGEIMAIMVGYRTALLDNPSLTTRLWPGPNPVRLVHDHRLKLPHDLAVFDDAAPTIVFNLLKHDMPEETRAHELKNEVYHYQVSEDSLLAEQVMLALRHLQITSVMIEGGTRLLQSFIDADVWDEARIITSQTAAAPGGLPGPVLDKYQYQKSQSLGTDIIYYYEHAAPHE